MIKKGVKVKILSGKDKNKAIPFALYCFGTKNSFLRFMGLLLKNCIQISRKKAILLRGVILNNFEFKPSYGSQPLYFSYSQYDFNLKKLYFSLDINLLSATFYRF